MQLSKRFQGLKPSGSVRRITAAKRKAEVQTEKNFPNYKGTLKQSLLKLVDEKDFVIESR